MDALDLARWQFGIVTVYHFLFVPITIGMGVLVAGAADGLVSDRQGEVAPADQVLRQDLSDQPRHGRGHRHRAGIPVGMNWSDYSRFVGDIFGAPLAIEALLAFFVESTFIGLWIFGWDRLPTETPPGVHLGHMALLLLVILCRAVIVWLTEGAAHPPAAAIATRSAVNWWAVPPRQ